MAYWLLKTEPSVYSYDDLVKDKKTVWDGVANPTALRHIRSIKKGDLVFVYHTGDEKQMVGIATVTSDPYPDPKQKNEKLVVFDIKPKKKLKRPVTLKEVKAINKYAQYDLVRLPRVSVMPVPEKYWEDFIKMSEK
ncbi:MAG: EVE domain-containing protein [Ignavibacteriae bacterium]|nr:EVE domain-containing protein [Ignavibacteriota bacterium]MCB9244143.1 EVE domain-containing protein [Ignavibacteriales bacterium]